MAICILVYGLTRRCNVYRYTVNKYCGRTYCGNGFFNTVEECLAFAKDGFCDKAVISDSETGEKQTIRWEV